MAKGIGRGFWARKYDRIFDSLSPNMTKKEFEKRYSAVSRALDKMICEIRLQSKASTSKRKL
ncbi:hypothetical protein GGC03_26900 (plasmid) [Vibrio sp. THAF191c]|nr:hypothetical protein FIU99_27070 [Vibrio sp. THAF64]QGM38001.1 hypothetical protein GGC04_27275 [Vibrio sp. THAF191d]QGN73419.1 hypothetical protein GGC03_26900 [Vibrio sp. THAF191c]